ncbi:sugar transporter SWEET1 [Nematolebias whitei]|uniref:sugar transporter SWEET1 n=1 Tax=Nematolebias whitei TaxID=451745 RepID=UPI00189AF511|nr:sugar transporter SWEET1 [Nematolebias whitei]
MFSTGLTDLKKMRESKSTENIQFLPFLTTCLNNLGWLFYGILKWDQTIMLVNIIGALLQILYIVMYFLYTKHKRLVVIQVLAAGVVLLCGWLYFNNFLTDRETLLSQLGLTCSVVTISMYLSPLFDLDYISQKPTVPCPESPLPSAEIHRMTSAPKGFREPHGTHREQDQNWSRTEQNGTSRTIGKSESW